MLSAVIFTVVMQYVIDFTESTRERAFMYYHGDGTDDWHGSNSLSNGNTYGTCYSNCLIKGTVPRKYS